MHVCDEYKHISIIFIFPVIFSDTVSGDED